MLENKEIKSDRKEDAFAQSESKDFRKMKTERFTDDIGMCENHTQSVERAIKLRTKATRSLVGFERRDGYLQKGGY